MNSIHFIAALGYLCSGLAYADSCSTPFKSCADVQKYRASVQQGTLVTNLIDPCAAYGTLNYRSGVIDLGTHVWCNGTDAPQMEAVCRKLAEGNSYLAALSPEEAEHRKVSKTLVYEAMKSANIAAQRVLMDSIAIKMFMFSNKIPSEMSAEDVRQAVKDFSAHLTKAAATLATQPGHKDQTVDNISHFVANQPLEDFGIKSFDQAERKSLGLDDNYDQKETLRTLLSNKVSSKDRYGQLFLAVSDFATAPTFMAEPFAPSLSRKAYMSYLSPYYARMILLFYTARKLRETQPALAEGKLDALAGTLQSKLNVTEATSQNVSFKNSVFHDGYIYGATPEMGEALLSHNPLRPEQSAAADCSLYMGIDMKRSGYHGKGLDSGRTSTADMLKNEWNSDSVEHLPICSEADLTPGDPIVMTGHTLIFMGYSKSAPYRMLMLEAAGGVSRRVQITPYDIYKEETSQKFSSSAPESCQNSIFTTATTTMQVLRLKTHPPEVAQETR